MDFTTVVGRCRQLHVCSREGDEPAEQPGREAELPCSGNVFGRICSSVDASPPLKLSTTPARKMVFIFGPDAIESVLLKMRTYEALLHLGFTPPYLYYEVVEKKYTIWLALFKSSVFSNEGGSLLVPATWEGVGELLRVHYPEAHTDFKQHLPELRGKEFKYFEKQAGFSFLEARKNQDSTDPNTYPPFYTYDYYRSLAKPRSCWQVRAFLYCELRLLELFTGDGVTSHPHSCTAGLNEYLCPNLAIAECNPKDIALLPLTVVFPS